jgi:AraC family transcriptional regulator
VPTPSETGSIGDLASGAGQKWLGASVWQSPDLVIQKVSTSASMTALTYHRGSGEATWRGDGHRLVVNLEQLEPVFVGVEGAPTRRVPASPPGTLAFYPAGLTVQTVVPETRYVQVLWDKDLYLTLLPEMAAAASGFEALFPFEDLLLSRIAETLAHEIKGGFADRILVESLGTALCMRVAQRFVGQLPLPTSGGLSPERLQRVRDYVEAHLDEDLSLTVLADIACLSPYHFSRSFKQAAGVGPQRYVIQRRLERAKTLMRRTREPLALIALEAGFGDQSHLTQMFRREMGVTPGRFRAALA